MLNNIIERFKLSPQQERLWLIQQAFKTVPVHAQCAILIEGKLDSNALKSALQEVVSRHEILHTAFECLPGMGAPLQVIRESGMSMVEEVELRGLSKERQEEWVEAELKRMEEENHEQAELKAKLAMLDQDEHMLLVSVPTLCADWTGMSNLFKELCRSYTSILRKESLLEETMQYAVASEWLNELLESEEARAGRDYWRKRDLASLTYTGLPYQSPQPIGAEFAPKRIRRTITREYLEKIEQHGQQYGASASEWLLTCWQILLWRLTGQTTVTVGVAYDGRTDEDLKQALGLFAKYLPIQTPLKEHLKFNDVLVQVTELAREAYEWQECFAWRNVAGLADDHQVVTFQFGFEFEVWPQELSDNCVKFSMRKKLIQLDHSMVKLCCVHRQGYIVTEFHYNSYALSEKHIERLAAEFQALMESVLATPDCPIAELNILGDAERESLFRFNATNSDLPLDDIHKLFERQVKHTPDNIAVICEDSQLSFAELNARSNQLAHYLRRLGVKPEVIVAICVDRSIDMAVGILGIWKAGGAYLPLDPNYPESRLTFMVEDSQATILLSHRHLAARLPEHNARIVYLDESVEALAQESRENPDIEAASDSLAYVIFTSGSTGAPKGAMIEQCGMLNHLFAKIQALGLNDRDVVAQTASQCFDISVWQFIAVLLVGGTVHIFGDDITHDPASLLDQVELQRVTILELVPSMMRMMLKESDQRQVKPDLSRLRWLIPTGEALPPDLCRHWFLLYPEIPLLNAYGPTECSDDVTHCPIVEPLADDTVCVSIGRPIANTQIYVLNTGFHPQPVGVVGALYIAGAGVGRGYLNEAAKTAESFVPAPFAIEAGARMYKSGDLACYLPDGNLKYLGRIDQQVKIRGFRIELGEIEAALERHPKVREAVVMAREDRSEEKRLVGYVVAEAGVTAPELRRHLRERLPEYMALVAIVMLEEMPVTANGKIDRKRLPAVKDTGRQVEQEYVGARTPVEDVLVGIFQEALKLDRVGIYDNFFELGGDSILSIQIISKANERGLGLTPKQLFQHQSVVELAAVARSGEVKEPEEERVLGEAPLTPIQEWFFEGNELEPEHHNQAVMLEAKEELDVEKLRAVIRRVWEQHDILRHRFQKRAGVWTQVCEEWEGGVLVEVVELGGIDPSDESRMIEEAAGEYQKRMNLYEGPLMRAVVFEGKGRRQWALIVAHHLVIDGVSWRILLADIERGYEQARRGEDIRLGAKTTSYKRWAEKLKQEAQSERARAEASYWLAIAGESVGRIPVDGGGANTIASSRTVTVSLSKDETRGLLQEVARAYKTQINEVLLSALARAVSEWSGERTVLVEVEGHGREEIIDDVDLTRTVGWFTTIYPVRIEVESGNNVELLRSAKERLREASRRGIYYGMLRYLSEESEVREKLRKLSRPEIIFNYLGQLDLVLRESALFRGAKEDAGESRSPKEKRRHLIDINGSVIGGRLSLVWTYSENIHRRETIEAVAERTMEALREIVAGSYSARERPYTPSDFPLARLEQRSLDRLMRGKPELEDIYALSPLQKAMLLHTLSGVNEQVLVVQLTCRLSGELDLEAFKTAWQRLVERHPMLRTGFEWEELEEPAQVVERGAEMPIEYLDWRKLSREEQESRFEKLVQSDRERGFELSKPPLMRVSVIRIGDELYRLIWSCHHLALDGWSSPLILQEVTSEYEGNRLGEQSVKQRSAPYREYIAWLKRQDQEKAEEYWRERLRGFRRPTKLWIDRGRGKAGRREEGYEDQLVELSEELTSKLQLVARQHRLTLNTMLQGAWGIVLSKYSGEEDLVFGTTVSGRPVDLPGSESIVGPFINTLPVRMQIDFQSSIRSWMAKAQSDQLEYGEYAYSALVEQYSEVPLGMPLYESILIFQNYPAGQANQLQKHGIEVSDIWAPVRTKYPLTIISWPSSELPLSIAYDQRRFDRADVIRLLAHFQNVIEGVAENPERPVWSLSLLSRSEQEQALAGWKGRRRIDGEDKYVHHWFEAWVEKAPDAIAVVLGSEQVSYHELNRRANQLARYLQRQGVGPETMVGLYLESSPLMLVGLLGIVKAGGTCVTFKPSDPREGPVSRPLLQDVDVSILLTQESLIAGEFEQRSEIIRLDSDWEMIGSGNETNPDSGISGENLAFIVSTSGITGEPKPVMITHRGWRNHLLGAQELVELTQEDRALQKGRMPVDVSILEVLGPLLTGARLVMAGPEAHQNRDWLLDLIIEQRITTASFTPSIFSLLLSEERAGYIRNLRRISLSGETLCRQVHEDCLRRLNVDLYNTYTVAEGSGAITIQGCRSQLEGEIVPVGRAIPNTRIYVLDAQLQPAPAGVAGEVWISGASLARGYAGQSELTAERYIPNPFSDDPGERMFGTKDLARCLPDGRIEVLARSESQIKIKFDQIEPAIIESALMECPGVNQAAIILVNDAFGGTRLAAYLACKTGDGPSTEVLSRSLKEKLPAPWIPSVFVMMKALPLTANDRIDRNALAEMDTSVTVAEIALAEKASPYEEMLYAIWAELFGLDKVGMEDNFFEMGGHSLLATRLVSRVREVFKIEIPLRAVFEGPTIKGLARRIEETLKAGENTPTPPLIRAERDGQKGERAPLSFAQQRLWFVDQLKPGNAIYNMPGAVRLEGQLNLEALEQSVNEIVRRHEALRTRIEVDADQAVQVIDEWEPRSLMIEDLSKLETEEREEEIRKIMKEEAETGFDLGQGPLLRVKVLRLGEEDHVLLYTMHHIVSDGWSMGVLVREFCDLYAAMIEGKRSRLPELEIQYADYARWQKQYLTGAVLEKHLAYWKKQLGGNLSVPDLPADRLRPSVSSYRGATKSFSLPAELSQSLRGLSRREGVTLFMTLLAAFKTLLYRYTAQEDIIVGTALANRNRAEIEPLIGFFVNMLPLRTDLSGNPTFRELLKRVKEVALGGYAHQDLPFEKLVEEIRPERAVKQMPLFNVVFGVQNAPREDLRLQRIEIKPIIAEQEGARFDLTIWVTEGHEQMQVSWIYGKDLFDADTIVYMHDHFEVLLSSIVDRPDARLTNLDISSWTRISPNPQGPGDWEDPDIEEPLSIKRRGINLVTNQS